MKNLNLGNRLWKLIETPQSKAFIGETIIEMSDEQVLEIAKGAIKQHEEAIRRLRDFLDVYMPRE